MHCKDNSLKTFINRRWNGKLLFSSRIVLTALVTPLLLSLEHVVQEPTA